MPAVSPHASDAEELADFLLFLSEWTAADRIRLADSLAQFMGDYPYEFDMFRHDLVRFRHLLGGEFEGDF